MFICSECNKIVEELNTYKESHGFNDGQCEIVQDWECSCGGEYIQEISCECCSEFIPDRETKVCEDCLSELITKHARAYIEDDLSDFLEFVYDIEGEGNDE